MDTRTYEQTTFYPEGREYYFPEINAAYYGKYTLTNDSRFYCLPSGSWYDELPDYEQEPELHRYHCMDEDCEYCQCIQYAISMKGYTVEDFVSYTDFIRVWPKRYDSDGDWFRMTPSDSASWFMSYTNLFPYSHWFCEEEEDEEDYEHEPGNVYGYHMGDEVDPTDFDGVDNGWIAPSGIFYYVPDYNRHGYAHEATAQKLGFADCNECERKGYIHVSSYYSRIHRFHAWPARVTDAQKEAVYGYAMSHDLPIPDELRFDRCVSHVKSESKEVTAYTYWQRVEDSCKPRAFRDRFYPLSGD